MTYFLLSPQFDLLGTFETDNIKAAKQKIREAYPFGTHFTAVSTAAVAELKTNAGKHNRKVATLPSDFNLFNTKQIQL